MKRIKGIKGILLIGTFLVFFINLFIFRANAADIGLSDTKKTMYVGQEYSIKLFGAEEKKIRWTLSGNQCATIDQEGNIKALKKGTAKITAEYNGKKYSCILTVKNVYLSKKELSLRPDETYKIKLIGSKIVKVFSSDKKIATISKNGTIKAIAPGKAKLIVTGANNQKYTCSILIKEIDINKKELVLKIDEKYKLELYRCNITKITSSDPKIVSVSKDGTIKALAPGNAIITITGDNKKKYTCNVTVPEPEPTIPKNYKALVKNIKAKGDNLYNDGRYSVQMQTGDWMYLIIYDSNRNNVDFVSFYIETGEYLTLHVTIDDPTIAMVLAWGKYSNVNYRVSTYIDVTDYVAGKPLDLTFDWISGITKTKVSREVCENIENAYGWWDELLFWKLGKIKLSDLGFIY